MPIYNCKFSWIFLIFAYEKFHALLHLGFKKRENIFHQGFKKRENIFRPTMTPFTAHTKLVVLVWEFWQLKSSSASVIEAETPDLLFKPPLMLPANRENIFCVYRISFGNLTPDKMWSIAISRHLDREYKQHRLLLWCVLHAWYKQQEYRVGVVSLRFMNLEF